MSTDPATPEVDEITYYDVTLDITFAGEVNAERSAKWINAYHKREDVEYHEFTTTPCGTTTTRFWDRDSAMDLAEAWNAHVKEVRSDV